MFNQSIDSSTIGKILQQQKKEHFFQIFGKNALFWGGIIFPRSIISFMRMMNSKQSKKQNQLITRNEILLSVELQIYFQMILMMNMMMMMEIFHHLYVISSKKKKQKNNPLPEKNKTKKIYMFFCFFFLLLFFFVLLYGTLILGHNFLFFVYMCVKTKIQDGNCFGCQSFFL